MGLPLVTAGYNSTYQILQTPTHVAIVTEMLHDVRIIPLDERSHLSRELQQWLGDSRGHWEGDTLVVETTNFSDKIIGNIATISFVQDAKNLRLVERFTRAGPKEITYEFTVDDPTVYTKPWTVSMPWTKAGGVIYEYACHEGNRALPGILRGARVQETDGGISNTAPR
jgi:hypothetical protein